MPDFTSRQPNRELVRQSEHEGAYRQLLSEASSLTPDVDAISQAIMDKKLYSPNKAPYMNAVNEIVGDYLGKFEKDPFYAFSREGRSAAGRLKQIVNHPDIQAMEQNTATTEKEFEKASTKNLNKNYVVRGNEVLAYKDGKRQYVPISQLQNLNPEKDQLLTVDEDMGLIRNHIGVRDGVPSYDMSKLEDVDKKIKDTLSKNNLGYYGSTAAYDVNGNGAMDLKIKNKSNLANIRTAVETLKRTGLTESDTNILKSEYLKSVPNPSGQGFNQWLDNKLQGIATGQIESLHDETPTKEFGAAGGRGGSSKTVELSAASRILNGLTGTRNVETIQGNTGQVLKGHVLPTQETLNNSSGEIKDELGNVNANRTLNKLKVFSDATDLKNLSVLSFKDGSAVKIPGLAEHGIVLDKPGTEPALVYQYTYRDQNGEPSMIPPNITKEILRRQDSGEKIPAKYQPYLTTVSLEQAEQDIISQPIPDKEKAERIASLRANTRPDGSVSYLDNKPWVDVTVGLPRSRGLFNSVDPEADQIGKQAQDLGYKSVESPSFNDYYAKHSGKGDLLDNSWHKVNDEMYEIKARVPLTSFEQLNTAYGGKTLGYPEDIHIDTSRLRSNYQLMSPDLFDQGTLPSLAKRKGLATLDDIH